MPNNQWIPCSERLPEQSDEYNVLLYIPPREGVRQKGIRLGRLKEGATKADPEGEWNFWGIPIESCDWSIAGWSYFEHPIPTHWMPLPEPPKEVSNADN